jgi:MoxR-like ATPase
MADEINRTPPKTQAALLQAMQEYRVTAGGSTFEVPRPFFVLATQNPIEQEGTYPLPEAQLDRFMFCLNMDYPSFDEEIQIVKTTTSAYEGGVERVVNGEEINDLQKLIRRIPVAADVISYAVGLVAMSRPSDRSAPQCVRDWVAWGAGPRASQYLILAAKTRAALAGRYTPALDDVRQSAKIVLRHRIITNFNAEADGIKTDTVIERLLECSNR